MDVVNDHCLGGGAGLYVEGGEEEHCAFFDDFAVKTIDRIDYTNDPWITRHARAVEGKWRAETVLRPGWPPSKAPALSNYSGELRLAEDSWPAPRLSVTVPVPTKSTRFGFIAGMRQSHNRRYVVTLGRSGDRLYLGVEEEGRRAQGRLASCKDVPLPAGRTLELCADFTRPEQVAVYVDGVLQLRTRIARPADGAAAFFARRAAGVAFPDLTVAFSRHEDIESPPKSSVYQKDPFMKHWASPQGAWWPVADKPDEFWHVGDCYGRTEVEVPLDENVELILAATAVTRDAGYALVQEKSTAEGAPPLCGVRLLRLGTEVAEGLVDRDQASEKSVVLHRDGAYVWLTAGGKEVFSFRDPEPLPGTRAALKGLKAKDLGKVKVRRYNVRDEYFERAPADWHAVGDWKVRNRFTCDPRWSHMVASTQSSAILFNKFQYEGDCTVETYMGMRMRADAMGSYPRIGDMNLALTRAPLDLAGGYSFVLAGWDPFWGERDTYLLKGAGRMAATTERLLPGARRPGEQRRIIPVPWISGGRDIHGAWYFIKARKQGGKIDFCVDNHQAYTWQDPDPIQRFSPAIWTYDAQVVVARHTVSYQKRIVPGRLVDPPAPARSVVTPDPAAPALVSTTHPGFLDDFEGGPRGWSTSEEDLGGEPAIVSRVHGRGHSLRVTNVGAGGTFAVTAPVAGLSLQAANIHKLQFDYRMEPEVKVNVYFQLEGQRYFVRLTGPEDSGAIQRRLGSVPVSADGKWHTVEFDLGAALRSVSDEAADNDSALKSMVFGNLHKGLLGAGLGGNPIGARYWLDNVQVISEGANSFNFQLPPVVSELQPTVALVAIDAQPDTTPTEIGALEHADLKPGLWYCHGRLKLPDGRLSATGHLPFYVSPAELKVEQVTPPDTGVWGYEPIRFKLAAGSLFSVNVKEMGLSVNGQPVHLLSDGVLSMDWRSRLLTVDLARIDPKIPDASPCAVEVLYTTRAGARAALKAAYTSSLAKDRTPPEAVQLVGVPMGRDFERDLGGWGDVGGSAKVMRDDSTAASGRWSAKVENTHLRGAFLSFPVPEAFSVGRLPIVEFDYKLHDAAMVDFALRNAGAEYTIGFADKGAGGEQLGSVPDIQTDNTWRHAQIDLLKLLKDKPYSAGWSDLKWLGVGDYGFRASAPGAYYHIDNFRQATLISGMADVSLKWASSDAAGIRGYSYVWSDKPDEEPDDQIDSTGALGTFTSVPGPDAYFHIKACDAAGNWGGALHYRFRVDDDTPLVADCAPADGERSASAKIRFSVTDESSAADLKTLHLAVNGQAVTVGDRGLQCGAEGKLEWDWEEGAPDDQTAIPDGSTVAVNVSATDFAGNTVNRSWQWTMDYSRDHQPPGLPVVTCDTMPVLHSEDFQRPGLGGWQAEQKGRATDTHIVRVLRDKKTQDWCLRLHSRRAGGTLGAVALQKAYDLATYPLVCFDYQIPANTKVNLQVMVNGARYQLFLSGEKARRGYGQIGKAEVVTDGDWHCLSVDLLALMKVAVPNQKTYSVSEITFGDPARSGNKAGAYWTVDNFTVAGFGRPEARFTWKSRDVTGIKGYSALFDKTPDTAPPRVVTSKQEAGVFNTTGPGAYYLRVQACDGNDNWSAPRRVPYFVGPDEKAEEQATPAP